MSDEHIDDIFREIQDELRTVRPSPEFAAKVRARVEAQPAWRWFGIWQLATAASVITVTAVGLTLWRSHEPVANPPVSTVAAVGPNSTPELPPATVAPPAESAHVVGNAAGPRGTSVVPKIRTQQVASRGPEVLVPADQRLALIALLDSIRTRGNQVPSETTPEVDAEGRLPAPVEIKVSPITIEPLSPPVPGGGSKERQ